MGVFPGRFLDMANLSRWLFVWLALVFGVNRLLAASSEENREFRAATNSLATSFWERAEREFAGFIAKYPESEHLPEAVLRQAQAQFHQRKYAELITLLTAALPKAGSLGDQYLYWLGEAQFQSPNYAAAAETFGRLARGFTNSPVRLEASLGEAASLARLKQWEQVAELLKKPDGAFRQAWNTP